jgi:hypothetical protein
LIESTRCISLAAADKVTGLFSRRRLTLHFQLAMPQARAGNTPRMAIKDELEESNAANCRIDSAPPNFDFALF